MGARHYYGVGRQTDVPKDSEGRPVGYVDDDVYEAARCFTGWTFRNSSSDPVIGNTGEFYYRADWHDRFQKHVLGEFLAPDQANLVDGQRVLDLLAFHPGTAQHVAYKLCRRLISDDPSSEIVQSTADVFYSQRESSNQLEIVLRYILSSRDFRTTWGKKTKRPFELITSTMRATALEFPFDIESSTSSSFFYLFSLLGQSLFQRKTPDGYPDTREPWLNTTTMVRRWNMINWLLTLKDDGENPRADILGQTPANVQTANDIVDYWIARILGRSVDAKDRDIFVEFMAQGRNPNLDLPIDSDKSTQNRLISLVALILMSPDFQWR
jgi:uncharacterized protein (DUF1800 family)